MVVADVGAGTGYMTILLARRVGPAGKVYASDLQPAMLQIIRDKARAQRLSNVNIVQGKEDDARLPENAIDLALLVDVYHELWRPQEMLRSIRRSLKPDGELILVEYRKEDPSIPIADTHRMSVADARAEVEAEGFTFDRLVPGLPRQHIIEFRR
jgi:ubiquinone/menaquinone biosynthesis C-methylase UbiE